MRRSAALWVALVNLACHSCHAVDAQSEEKDPPRIPVTIETDTGPVVFSAEIADTPSERSRGLMYRTSMKDEHAMLFLFPEESQQSFWMKNTLIPLDIIFIRKDKTILGIIESATPKTEISRSVPGASQYVLEINGGLSKKLGIKAFQTVKFMSPY